MRSQTANCPNVLCMVVHVLDENLQHVRTIRMWRGEFGKTPPFDIGPDALFVAYSAWAEMTCFMTLGWKFPEHIFDLHTAYLAASNMLLPYNPDEVRKRERKRLSDACRAYGIEGWENIDKEAHRTRPSARVAGANTAARLSSNTAKKTSKNRPNCCASNCVAAAADCQPARVEHVSALVELQRQGGRTESRRAACRSTCRCGIWCRRTRPRSFDTCYAEFDPSHGSDCPIYTPDGEWSYDRFEQLARERRRNGMAAIGKRPSSTSTATPSG